MKVYAAIFLSVFVAELGDKTQLATLLFASRPEASRWTVFIAAVLALSAAAALGVLAGGTVFRHINPKTLSWIAGLARLARSARRRGSER